MMDSSLSASVLSTKNLVTEASSGGHQAELETRGRGEKRDPGPGRTYRSENWCRQSTRSVSVIILGYLALGAVTFTETEAEGGSPSGSISSIATSSATDLGSGVAPVDAPAAPTPPHSPPVTAQITG